MDSEWENRQRRKEINNRTTRKALEEEQERLQLRQAILGLQAKNIDYDGQFLKMREDMETAQRNVHDTSTMLSHWMNQVSDLTDLIQGVKITNNGVSIPGLVSNNHVNIEALKLQLKKLEDAMENTQTKITTMERTMVRKL